MTIWIKSWKAVRVYYRAAIIKVSHSENISVHSILFPPLKFERKPFKFKSTVSEHHGV